MGGYLFKNVGGYLFSLLAFIVDIVDKFSNIFSNIQYKLDVSVTLCHILICFVTRRVYYAGTKLHNTLLSNIEVVSHGIKEFKSTWIDIS